MAYLSSVKDPKQYAAEVRERNKPQCQCDRCVYERNLERAKQITANWTTK